MLPLMNKITWEKLTITGRICATQSWGSNNFPRAPQPSTANNRTESWSEMDINLKQVNKLTPQIKNWQCNIET